MIYFDDNKKAYAFEIQNAIATIDDETWSNYAGTDQWDIVNGVFVGSPDIEQFKQNEIRKQEIKTEIDEIDRKRIRALAEGGNKETGLTWLQYYNQQIIVLRTELAELD